MVQGRQALRAQSLERFHFGHQGPQQQRLQQPGIIAQVLGRCRIGLPQLDRLPGHVVLPLQHRQQALVVKALGILKVQAHAFAEGFITLSNGVVQVTHRNQLAQLQVCAAVHKQLQHQLESRALALQGGRHGNQGLHQRWRERVHLPEHVAVCRGGQERVQHILAHFQQIVEGALQSLARDLVDGTQHALFGNGGQIAVFQRDAMKTSLPVLEHIAELHLHRASQVFTHQVTQIALPRHETDQRNGPVGIGRLHQLDELCALTTDKIDICRMAGQPEHQLVQEQDDGVIAQRLGVSAHDAQSIVERHERLTAARQRPVGREELRDQIAHQARALLTVRRLQHCSFKGHRIPTTFKCPPAAIAPAAGTLVEFGEEGIITHAITQIACILEHAFGQIKTWHWRIGMQLAHELSVLPQDGRLHIARTNHVVRHEQEFAPIRPAVAGHHIGQLRCGPRLGVARQQ